MRAGKLRNQVNVRNLVEKQSTITGELVRSWSTVIVGAWASIEPLSGREYFASQQTQSRIDTKITLRYNSTQIHPKMIVANGTNLYEIESIIRPDLIKRELHLMCFQRVAT